MKTTLQRPGLSDGLASASLLLQATITTSKTSPIVPSSSSIRCWREKMDIDLTIWLTKTQMHIGMLWTHMTSLMKKTSRMSNTSMLNGKLRWMVMSLSVYKAHLLTGATSLRNSVIRSSRTLSGMTESYRQTILLHGHLNITAIGRKCIRRP